MVPGGGKPTPPQTCYRGATKFRLPNRKNWCHTDIATKEWVRRAPVTVALPGEQCPRQSECVKNLFYSITIIDYLPSFATV